MRRLAFITLGLAACATPGSTARNATIESPQEREVLEIVRGTFDAMRSRDTATLRTLFHPEARIVMTGFRDGQPSSRAVPIAAFLNSIGGASEQLDERIYDPEVRIDDNLATVWTRYDFHVGSRFSHCGVDAIQLIRTAAGWRIIHVTDTHRTDNCPGGPEG